MAEDKIEENENSEDEEKTSKGKRLPIIIIAIILLLGGIGAGLYFTGMLDSLLGTSKEVTQDDKHIDNSDEKKSEHGDSGDSSEKSVDNMPVFYQMPEILVNLNTGGKGTSFLKMTIALEVPDKKVLEKIKTIEPRLLDSFNTYLRELRASDLSGSIGLYRLREELLIRINKAINPAQINDILFKQIIVQ